MAAHRAFPSLTLALAAATVGAYAVELAGAGQAFCELHGLVPIRFVRTGNLATLFMSTFLHDPGSWLHFAGNLAVLLLVGARVEAIIGSLRFAAIYFAGGLAGGLLHVLVDPSSTTSMVGCSGALFAVLAVAATLFGPGMLAFTAVLVAANVWHAFAGDVGPVSFGCHIGGFCVGVLVVLLRRANGLRWATV